VLGSGAADAVAQECGRLIAVIHRFGGVPISTLASSKGIPIAAFHRSSGGGGAARQCSVVVNARSRTTVARHSNCGVFASNLPSCSVLRVMLLNKLSVD